MTLLIRLIKSQSRIHARVLSDDHERLVVLVGRCDVTEDDNAVFH